ncbi:putative ribonuclease H-like domain-containing protein, partial [Tanacetum coccineum]
GFLWCHGPLKRGKAKVAWEVVCLPKDEGGLGILRLEYFNSALMVSHIWKLLSFKESLWVKWIHEYKLNERSFWDVPLRGNMSWGSRKMLQLRPIIHDFIWCKLDDGARTSLCPIPTSRINSIHPSTLILGDPQSAVQTRSKVTKSSGAYAFVSYIQKQRRNNHKDFQHCLFACFLSQNEPKKISEALEDESWVDAMQEELLQFKIQKVWILVDLPYGKKAIGTKWVYRNKKDERRVVVRNKTMIEAIRIFLAFASYMGFIVYQMDVKSAFLYGKIDEEVYVSQPLGFIDPKYPKKVYKVVKALYGLHQAPRAWYATLSTFLLKNGYRRGTIDKTLFIKKDKHDIILVQVYVDDIIFGSTKKSWCDEFEVLMKNRFQMSSMGELTFFLGLQVKQKEDVIFISQDKYVAEILKKFDFVSVKTASTPIETQKPLVKDEEASDVDVHLYRSMIGSLMYLTASRSDIMFAVCACSRFQVNPKTSHLSIVKRIFRFNKWSVHFPVATGPRNRVVPNRKPKDKPRFNEGAKRLFIKKQHHREIILKLDPSDHVSTSVMIRNIPNNYTRELLVKFLEDHCKTQNEMVENDGKSAFDFVYPPIDFKHRLNVGYTFVNFTTSEASKNSLVKHFEDMRLCRPSKEYLQVWFDPPRDVSMSCLTTKGMRNNGVMCARIIGE